VCLGALAAAAVATRPLVLRLGDALAGNLGDPLLNTFILAWNADRIAHGFSGYWTAPLFFPLQATLALSEHLFGVAIFTAPLQWATGNPVLVHNTALLASYALAALGVFLLARDLWGRAGAAWVGAAAFAFSPLRAAHVTHLQVLMSGWTPLALFALHRYLRAGSRRALAGFTACVALQALSNGYFMYYAAVPIVVVIVADAAALLRGDRDGRVRVARLRRTAAGLAGAAVALALVLAPFAAGYLDARARYGFRRGLDEIAAFSAVPVDFARVDAQSLVWGHVLPPGTAETALFPGALVLVLALVGLVTIGIRRPAPDLTGGPVPTARWTAWTYAAIAVLTAWMALGPDVPGPYRWLLHIVPGLDGLRVPARMAVMTTLGLSVLAAAGFAWLAGRMPRRASIAAAAVATMVVLAEGIVAPVPLVPFDPAQRARQEVNAWLRQQPPGAVLDLPVAGPALAPFTLVHQYNALLHGRPIVNGYSGSGSALQDLIGGAASPFNRPAEIPPTLDGLRRIGVRYLVVHRGAWADWPRWRPDEIVAAIDADPEHLVETRARFGDTHAWRLAPAPGLSNPVVPPGEQMAPGTFGLRASVMEDRLRFTVDGDLQTRWHSGAPQRGGEWIAAEVARETDVSALRIETHPDGRGDFPRGLLIESEAADGTRVPLFDGSFLPLLVDAVARDGARAPVVIPLPANRSRILWLRQTRSTRTWYWGVSELRLYRRTP
jgi:hypothetical protein